MGDLTNFFARDNIVPFARPRPVIHYTGFILHLLRALADTAPDNSNKVRIDEHQENGAHGVHQARVRLCGDDKAYRLILAPVDAPIQINGRPIDEYFGEPLTPGAA